MALFLVQHGKSLSKDLGPEKGLSEEGEKEVRLIANVAKTYHIDIDEIKHSGKKRARQTAEIFYAITGSRNGVSEMTGLNPMDSIIPIADSIISKNNLMIVGHLPFMERLTAYLTCGNPDVIVFKFQNGGIVCLDQLPDPSGWVIKWALMPDIK